MEAIIDYYVDRYGNLWVIFEDGSSRRATEPERRGYFNDYPEMLLQLSY